MPAWSWIVIAVVVVIVVALAMLVARSVSRRKRTERLKNHFGPEYDRAVGESGEQGTAEKELVARERNRQKLDIVVLTPESRAKYAEHWRTVQTAFVDNPSRAVGDAGRLVTEVMRERGYPVDDFDQRAADISVDHPNVVEHYRAAHIIHLAQEKGDIGTEAQREAFVHYRALFEKLLETEHKTEKDTPKEARA
jgi:DNA-binding MarR family transcriptional regulator